MAYLLMCDFFCFLRMRIFNFFLNHMVQKYQNEIAPIFYYGKSSKTNEKDLKIPILWPLNWGQPYWMTLYKYDQPGKILFMQMHAQMYKCTSYLQLATWTYGQVTRTVIFNPHHKQYNFKFSIGFTQSFFNNIIY